MDQASSGELTTEVVFEAAHTFKEKSAYVYEFVLLVWCLSDRKKNLDVFASHLSHLLRNTQTSFGNNSARRAVHRGVLLVNNLEKGQKYSAGRAQFSIHLWRKEAEMWLALPLAWMKSVCCTIKVVGLWSAKSPEKWHRGREWAEEWCGSEQRMKPSAWMNEWTMNNGRRVPSARVRAHVSGGRTAMWRPALTLGDQGIVADHRT